jgi:hypothetical protein
VIELASVIRDLRDELERAIAAGEGEQLRFELGPIELEATVAVDRSDGASGKVRFWVAEAGADRKKDSAATQRIKLTLAPKLAGARRPPHVAGTPEPSEE